ncbi:MAG: D-tyrosyl-tRNA(Tyr) deacylase [Verrucomicrobia bacterium]|nr:D-tyrosyl-tRNA(Tyr) deacylase [Verrucomicrobiota bacterium]
MRAVVQLVKEASVTVENRIVGKIGAGLMVLFGIHKDDTSEKIPWMVQKLIHLRIFSDEQGKMNRSVLDIGGEILVVSQFTLYGNCNSGRRPDFLEAARPEMAKPIYEKLVQELSTQIKVKTGEFGAMMEVSLVNDGPVTLILEH